MATTSVTGGKIETYLGGKADSLLGFKSPKIPKERLHLPGPDFIDLQIGRPDLVSVRGLRRHHQRRQQTGQRDLEPPPLHRSRPHCGNTPVDAIGA